MTAQKKTRIQSAQAAYKQKDIKRVKASHRPDKIAAEAIHQNQFFGKYIGDMVYGASDGIVTTFAIVSGVVGASLSPIIILILGFANLVADGISMALGNYLGLRSEQDYHQKERERELWEIENYPEGEIEEVRDIYRKKGFKGKDLERAVQIVTSDKEVWLKTMMLEELNIIEDRKNPVLAGLFTFITFSIAGLVPLASYVGAIFFKSLQGQSFVLAIILTGISIFIIGSLRTLIIAKKWYIAGLEMLLVAGVAAGAAYFIGYLASLIIA